MDGLAVVLVYISCFIGLGVMVALAEMMIEKIPALGRIADRLLDSIMLNDRDDCEDEDF